VLEAALVALFWAAMAARAPAFFLATYLPGYLAALALCALHGHYEHAGGTISHYGRLYNVLLFNDGYHVEHHANPGVPWNRLPQLRAPAARGSRWPAPLRWLERLSLDGLERLVLHSRLLQRVVLRTHARALRDLISTLPAIDRVAIVGGGLFPRSYLILRELLPSARVTIVDANLAFVYELNAGRARLFDMANDPDERRNIAGLHAGRARAYERTLRSWSAAQKQALAAAALER
jgi:hypothetical protein